MRYFIGTEEVTEAQVRAAEHMATARVARGGSGVVPVELRQPGETPEQYLSAWIQMEPIT